MLSDVSLSKAFSTLLNLGLKAQPHIDVTMLEGRSFVIAINELPQDIAIAIENGKVVVLDVNAVGRADVTVSGSLKAVLCMINNGSDGLENDALYIMGKISTARLFQQFLASFSVDLQGFFAQFMPPEQASKAAEALEQGIEMARAGAEHIGETINNHLLENKGCCVAKEELDELRKDIDSLGERIDLLLTRIDGNANNA